MHHILIKPIITEHSMDQVGKGKFTFLVPVLARKKAIRSAIEKKFNVKVIAIATTMIRGRTKRVGTRRVEVVQPTLKKAVVKLKEGQKIAMFDVS